MSSGIYWTCQVCGMRAPAERHSCPNCTRIVSAWQNSGSFAGTAAAPRRNLQWLTAASFLSAILGIVAFFLPWFQVSIFGFINVRFSGYEIATGQWQEKVAPERTQRTANQFEDALREGFEQGAGRKLPPANRIRKRPLRPESRQQYGQQGHFFGPGGAPDGLLWLAPIASLVLLILGFFGFPRIPAVGITTIAAACLGFASIMAEQQLNDPANTLGLVSHSWLVGFWLTWLALVPPTVAAILRSGPQVGTA